jgi:hypothetical protein
MDESSDSHKKEVMYVDRTSISKTDKANSPSENVTDKTDKNRTYQSRIENLGVITNDEWHQPVVTNTSNEDLHAYTNECYVTAATLFDPSKKPKKKHLSSIILGWMYNRKGDWKGKDFKHMRVLLDSGCGGTLVNRSFVKKYKKTNLTKSTN